MIYLVEKINEQGMPVLGTESRHIFRKHQTLKSLERYQIKRLVKNYGVLWVSEYTSDMSFYGKPIRVWKYENSETHARGFWKCIIWKQ